MVSSPGGLGVSATHNKFRDQRVHIEFRSRAQADAYLARISRTSVVERESLAPEKSALTEVSLRLPFRVSKIVTSTTCRGFYLEFTDTVLARNWKADLLIWKSVPGQQRRLYVDRDISDGALRRLLDSDRGPAGENALVAVYNVIRIRAGH
ncbi:hypothetical protein PG996_009143 [Apiospora saccharicola]|uniref:Uncharacterized protein n=1 Tax=Apiospora saccharicola TaxID=335842 RepID=A0ABR1UJY2_9PEZI